MADHRRLRQPHFPMSSSVVLRSRALLARSTIRHASGTPYVPGGRAFFPFLLFPSYPHPTQAIYRGTVNDPTDFPPPSRTHGSHHWAFERLLSASLVPLTAAAYVTTGSNYPVIDGLLGISLVVHSHLGVRLSSLLVFG